MARLERLVASCVLGGALLFGHARAEEPAQPPAQQQDDGKLEVPKLPWDSGDPVRLDRGEYISRAKDMIAHFSNFCKKNYYEWQYRNNDYAIEYEDGIAVVEAGVRMLEMAKTTDEEYVRILPEMLSAAHHYANEYEQIALHAIGRMPRESVTKAAWSMAENGFDMAGLTVLKNHCGETLPRDRTLTIAHDALESNETSHFYRARELLTLFFDGNLPNQYRVALGRKYLRYPGYRGYARSHYADAVRDGFRLDEEDINAVYSEMMRANNSLEFLPGEETYKDIPLPTREVRAIHNTQLLVNLAYRNNKSITDLVLDNLERPLDVPSLQHGAALMRQSFDLAAYRTEIIKRSAPFAQIVHVAQHTTPLTVPELEKYLNRLLSYPTREEFSSAVAALEELRRLEKFHALRPAIVKSLEEAIENDDLSSDDISRGIRARYGIGVFYPPHRWRQRAERLADKNPVEYLRTLRQMGDERKYTDELMGVLQRARASADPNTKLPYLAQAILTSDIAANDKDAAMRLGELLYDDGMLEQARDCYRYVGTEAARARIAMCERKMRAAGSFVSMDDIWPARPNN